MGSESWLSGEPSYAPYFLADQCLAQYFGAGAKDKEPVFEILSGNSMRLWQPRQQSRLVTASPSLLVSGSSVVEQRVVHVADLGDPRLHLTRALPVCVYVSREVVTAFSHDIDEMGTGVSESEALDDFRRGVVAAYFLLKEEQKRLGPLQRRHWDFLRSIAKEQK